jgi:hypothetical protein
MDRGILGGVGEAPSGGLMSPAAIREYLLQEAERQRLGRASLDRDLAALRRPGMNVVPNVIEFAKANPVEAGLLGVGMSPVPVVSDVAGFAGDMLGMYNRPEDRTLANLGLAAAGLIPGLPALGALTFGGKGAKTADMVALARAHDLENAGSSADDIWRETGWGRGADGEWRFEIDDSGATGHEYQLSPQQAFSRATADALFSGDSAASARLEQMKPYASKSTADLLDEYRRTGGEIVAAAERGDIERALSLGESRSGLDAILDNMRSDYGPVSSYLKHDDLNAAYPDVSGMHARVASDDLGGARGQYFQESPVRREQIVMNEAPTWSGPRSTALHELQHAVQQREGFARGGSPTAFVQEAKAKLADLDQQVAWINEQLRLSDGTPDYNRFLDMREDVLKKMRAVEGGSPYGRAMGVMEQANDQYRALAGEVEARNVQKRMDMDAATRRATPPWATEDVPRDQQIVRRR